MILLKKLWCIFEIKYGKLDDLFVYVFWIFTLNNFLVHKSRLLNNFEIQQTLKDQSSIICKLTDAY